MPEDPDLVAGGAWDEVAEVRKGRVRRGGRGGMEASRSSTEK